ncbi:MAG: mannitol dehydrogenase family protein [Devosia sp.]
MIERLSNRSIGAAKPGTQRPLYARNTVTAGIVHLGIGAFHRAHQAVVVDDLLEQDSSWGIVGASLRRPDTKEALAPQDGLYSVLVKDGETRSLRVIGSVLEVLDAPNEKEALLARMADPATRIVSLTVTEKGYCYNAATGGLDLTHPDIVADLAQPRNPASAAGIVTEALRRRREAGIAPFTVLSCDNLPHNGAVALRVFTEFAEAVDPGLGRWVRENVAFPGTMIDRIVPATTDADRAEIAGLLGLEDAWPVVGEPFLQWVIEDKFVGARPPFDLGGAEFVADVAPYERMKLRMLNGSHSMMAYLGYLSGHEFIAQVIAEPSFRAFVSSAMAEEIAPTLGMATAGTDAYASQLLERFSNTALRHRTYQIAMDGSQKLPQRLLGTIADRLKAGAPFERLALGVAAWMIYARGVDENGNAIPVQDPMAAEFAKIDPARLVDEFLAIDRVFPPDLAGNRVFREAVGAKVALLREIGAAEAVRRSA